MTDVLVWHRGDLRVQDNPALAAADEAGDPVPVFVVDPELVDGLACPDRVRFVLECVESLREAYRERGSDLAVLYGKSLPRVREAAAALDCRVYYNRETTAAYGRERERAAELDDRFEGFDADAVRRDVDDPRDGWDDHAEAWMTGDRPAAPRDLPSNPLDDDVTLDEAIDRHDLAREKERVPRGGRVPAERRLDRFLDTIQEYPGSISAPADAERHCSRLSPYFAAGALSVREAHARAMERAPDCTGRELFVERLYWNQHFRQKLEDFPEASRTAINPVFRNFHREERDPDLVAAWKRGETGFPLVDAGMRALVETGYVNFRLRALCATFFVHVLRQWWKEGADFYHYHLIDADAAINYEQWQMQAAITGAHPPRVYDPAKNAREHDPDGEYVRRYVPELEPVPDEHLPEPHRMPPAVQSAVGVEVGTDYPRPVVDFERRRRRSLEEFAALSDRAREALADPEIRRRASLSSRHDDVEEEWDTGGQTSLEEF